MFQFTIWYIIVSNQRLVFAVIQPDCESTTNHYKKETFVSNFIMLYQNFSQISNCSLHNTAEGLNIDCSNRGFTTVPKLPSHANVVNFSRNAIAEIPPHAFVETNLLVDLDMSYNMFNTITPEVFKGLANLKRLSIQDFRSKKPLDAVSLDNIIQYLTSLNNLTVTLAYFSELNIPIYNNGTRNEYPNIKRLNRIETLTIDVGIVCKLSKVANLPESNAWNVKYLTLSNTPVNFCNKFTYYTFQLMPKLVSLRILTTFSHNSIHFDADTFTALRNLESITVTAQSYPSNGTDFPDILRNIVKSLTKAAKLNRIEVSGFSNPILVPSDVFAVLKKSQTLDTIILNMNGLYFARESHILVLPESVRSLELLQSCISLSNIKQLLGTYNLELLRASIDPGCSAIWLSFDNASGMFIRKSKEIPKFANAHNLKIFQYTRSQTSFNLGDDVFQPISVKADSLRYLDVSYDINIDIDDDFFSNWGSNLEYIDLSYCHLPNLLSTTLQLLPNVTFLSLSGDYLDGNKLCYGQRKINEIIPLDYDSFAHMKGLRVLDLSNNCLQSFKPSLLNCGNLILLNLSRNMIKTLSTQNMNDFDELTQRNAHFTIDLRGQAFWCTCETIAFLEWIQTTKTTVAAKDTYECDNPKKKITEIVIKNFKRSCSSNVIFLIATSVGVILLVALIIGLITYRYKWRLRYLFFMAKLNLNIVPKKQDYSKIYDFDAFISYASEDFQVARISAMENLEGKYGLKLCIHERDFMPGDSIAFNISKGIHGSRRTLLFLSKDFFASEWCRYEINIARMEAIYTQREVMLVILLEDVPRKSMNVEILDVINTSTYIEYPSDNRKENIDLFWNKCYNFILNN